MILGKKRLSKDNGCMNVVFQTVPVNNFYSIKKIFGGRRKAK
jgi:hypothetical protein